MSDQPFIVQAWLNNPVTSMEEYPAATITEALSVAHGLACDRKYRQAMVTDDSRIIWAQFNLLWKVIPQPVGESEGDHASDAGDQAPALG